MKQQLLVLMYILFLAIPLYSQDTTGQSEFKKFAKEQQQGIQQEEQAFQNYKAEVTKQYDDWLAEQERLFREYTGQIEKKWGKNNVKTSTNKEYVAYDPNFSARKSVNFEEGKAKVEIVVTESEAKDRTLIQEKLKEEIKDLVTTKGGTDPFEKKTDPVPLPQPILTDQVVTKEGKPVTEQTAKQFAEQTVTAAQVTQEVVTGKDGIKRIVLGVQFPLVPNHVKKRATEFKDQILAQAQKNGIEPALVFAIMHTESYFNPKAKSPVPAFGLMQLVPRSGGRDAYLFVYKKDSLVTGDYLYVSDNNIILGSGYLTKLMTVEFRGVKDPKSKVYCTISAYNTGPGNVAKAFTGKRNVKEALLKINAMSSDELFEYLKKNLPFEETRVYVAKVSERMGLYNEWSK